MTLPHYGEEATPSSDSAATGQEEKRLCPSEPIAIRATSMSRHLTPVCHLGNLEGEEPRGLAQSSAPGWGGQLMQEAPRTQ